MSHSIQQEEILITAICKLSENQALNEIERSVFNEYLKDHPLADLKINSKLVIDLEDAASIAEESLPEFQKKMAELSQKEKGTMEVIPGARVEWMKWTIAAAVVVVVIGVLVLKSYNVSVIRRGAGFTPAISEAPVIRPGGNKATLFLANNKPIVLEEMSTGQVWQERNARIEKKDSGFLAYQKTSSINKAQELNNTLVTPRAGTYRLQLSDGTIAYLNAQSSLTYPEVFTGDTREVVLNNGEVYFEVAHGAKPFIVKYQNMKIKVLGTKFNVNTYKKESNIATALLEGSVEITNNTDRVVLKPSQQAVLVNGSLKTMNLDIPASAIAWTKGDFSFDQLSLREIMRQVERWYDVEVIFEEEPGTSPITMTSIPRSHSLPEFLNILREPNRFNYIITPDRQVIIKK